MTPRADIYEDYATRYAEMVAAREERGVAAEPMIPELLEILGDVQGLAVLDAGCGEGYLSRILAALGAKVTGIDISANLLSIARGKSPADTINYIAHDLSQPLPEYAEHFDLIASHFVLNDVPDFRGFADNMARLLKPGGRAVFSGNNPYSFVVRNHIKDYFSSGVAYSYRGMAQEGVKVYFYQRTLQEYLDGFFSAGLRLERLVDVPTPEAMLNSNFDKLVPPGYQFPYFMIMSFSKDARS